MRTCWLAGGRAGGPAGQQAGRQADATRPLMEEADEKAL